MNKIFDVAFSNNAVDKLERCFNRMFGSPTSVFKLDVTDHQISVPFVAREHVDLDFDVTPFFRLADPVWLKTLSVFGLALGIGASSSVAKKSNVLVFLHCSGAAVPDPYAFVRSVSKNIGLSQDDIQNYDVTYVNHRVELTSRKNYFSDDKSFIFCIY